MCIVTIVTPTYNRGNLLPRLYESLCQQTVKDFQWLIIDDGSQDNTQAVVKSMNNAPFLLEYHYKENGGKHTALNYSHPHIKGDLVFIVDSDDTLTSDAVETILGDWQLYKNKKEIGIISYLKGRLDGSSIANSTAPDRYISTHLDYRINHNIVGDMAEVIRTDVFQKYPLPVFPGERFMPEGWLWNLLSFHYKTVYRRKIIYHCEYLEGGLTKSGRKLLMNNPLGLMAHCKTFFVSKASTKAQIKEMLLYGVYGFCAHKNVEEILSGSGRTWKMLPVIPFSLVLYLFWKGKYLS